jgi:peroxiredoxin
MALGTGRLRVRPAGVRWTFARAELNRAGVKSTQIMQVAFAAAAAVAVFAFVRTAYDAEARRACAPLCALHPDYANTNRIAPDFALQKVSGGIGHLSDYRGQVVVMNFWSKACRPCLEEMPSLAQFARVLAAQSKMRLIAVSTDESVEDVRNTIQSVLGGPAPFDVFVDPDAQVVTGKYGTKLYPETWFIDASGIIRARVDGARDWSEPLPLVYSKTLEVPTTCTIRMSRGEPEGEWARICEDVPPAG